MSVSTRPQSFDASRALFDVLSGWSTNEAYAVVQLPAPSGLEIALLERFEDEVAFVESADGVVVGIGAAYTIEASGPRRFDDLVRAAGRFEPSVRSLGEVAARAPVFLGGVAFEATFEEDGPWHDFGAARFVVPRWTYRSDEAGASLQLVVEGEAAQREADRVAGEYRALVEAVRRPETEGPAGEVRREDASDYVRSVASAVEQIRAGHAQKIVLSREATVARREGFSVAAIVEALRSPDAAAVFAFRIGGRTFLGATPERLVRVRGRAVTTEALAGTAPRASDAATLTTGKNIEEHEHVVRWIHDRLVLLSDSVVISERRVRRLPHVVHLTTPIAGRLRDETHVLRVADALHPTPAVAGAPLEVALEAIRGAEGRDRGWYAGAIGTFDVGGDGDLYVALRSALVEGDLARVFVGAGIVADSDPDAELAETIAKEKTMLDALAGDSRGRA